MTAILKITDGTETTETNLLCLPGFQLESWRPQIAGYKGDGTFQSSPLAPGRQLVNKQFDNIIETFQFKAKDVSQDALIEDVQNLVRMLEKATSYWSTDWQDVPVYIEAKATDETNTRYGHIMSYRIPELENPYGQPFLQRNCESVMDNLTLIIEHTPWTENVPGVGTDVEISAVETYDGRNLGNVDSSGTRDATTANEVYIANKRNIANITDIYVDDGGVFGPNLMDAALPFNLLPAVPAVNDAIYFGIDNTVVDDGPFCSLVFDIGTAGSGYTGLWEFGTGAGWAALTVQDNTNAFGAMTGITFDTTGVNSVHWEQQATWATRTVNGIGGLWIRYKITGTPGALASPIQQNRDIYSIIWAYTEIQSAAMAGDIPALSKIQLIDQSDRDGSGGSGPDLYEDRVIVGLRSTSRGLNYTPYLNLGDSDDQNPSGITITLGANMAVILIANAFITGERVGYGPLGVEALADRVTFTLSSSLMLEYYGKFRVFLRGEKSGSTDTITIRLKAIVGSGGIQTFSDTLSVITASGSAFDVFDLGTLEIPGGKLNSSETGDQTEITIQCGSDGGTDDFFFSDLILMPVDEWGGDFSLTNENTSGLIQNNTYLLIDSIEKRKGFLRSVLFNDSDQSVAFYQSISNGESILQANTRQRLWFFFMRAVYSGGSFLRYESRFESAYKVVVQRNQQYITMRGDR